MALFAIPNPKKTFSVDYSIDKVKKAVLAIPFIDKKYKYTKSNDVLNQHTLEALEFLSLGVFIDFNLSSISENKTEITVEIRRKVGSFDQSHEITNANKHIEAIVDNLSKGITLTDVDIENLKKAESDKAVVQKEKEKHANKRSLIIGAVIILVIIIFNLLKK
jgi:hypothetical protein